jgi:serine protease DegS
MAAHTISQFILRTAVVGVLAALAVIYLLPDHLLGSRPVVELHTSAEAPATTRTQGPVSYADAVKRAAPAVVNVYTTKTVVRRSDSILDDPLFRRFFGDQFTTQRKQTQTSLGSGVIISPQGYVLTNNHVVEDADEIELMLSDGRTIQAKVVGTDPETDLSVLKVAGKDLPAVVVGESDALQVGDVVLAIGNPYGVGKTVTQGIVSATGRNHLGINTFEDFIQTDAAINPGNSGGALINARGELVGINTAIFSRSGGSQGIGFAIPVSLAQDVMTQIIESGQVTRGWLGIEVQDLSPALAESFALDQTQGVLIAGVIREGPAHRAGIRPGDVIIALEGQPITGTGDALKTIARHKPGEPIQVKGLRQGKVFRVTARTGRRPNYR